MADPLHSLLRRQLTRVFGGVESVPDSCLSLVTVVNEAYRQADLDRTMLERSLELSSQELSQANSEMRSAVLALREAHQELEHRVAERTRELASANEYLRQAQKMEAIGQLAGGIAHDFNNMLTAILGYADLVATQVGPNQPVYRDLQEIITAAHRAATLTRQLLAFGRKQVFQVVSLDLNQVVRDLEPLLRRLIGENIAIKSGLAPELHPVLADSTQLTQVLMNLAVNARDAMPDGGVLQIDTRNIDFDDADAQTHMSVKPGPYVLLSVTDTGIGMSSSVLARIFEPFFTTKERGHGTGLGLAAVYGIVKQLGGHIGVDSEPDHGSTFRIYFPKTERPIQAAEPPAPVARPVGRETIVLVEDEPGVRALTKRALERYGYRVLEAQSAEAALALLAALTEPVDLLLTDVMLPGMDGCQLAEQVRQHRPALRVLYMSGYSEQMVGANGTLIRHLDFLEKPFLANTLLTRVRDTLARDPSTVASQNAASTRASG